jgi:hypothetical protein
MKSACFSHLLLTVLISRLRDISRVWAFYNSSSVYDRYLNVIDTKLPLSIISKTFLFVKATTFYTSKGDAGVCQCGLNVTNVMRKFGVGLYRICSLNTGYL